MAAEHTRQPHPWGQDPEVREPDQPLPGRQSPFRVDDIALGPHAHGFGVDDDGRSFSFRVVGPTMTLRVYRADVDPAAVPGRADVHAMAAARVADVDLSDERSVIAMVRDMTAAAVPVAHGPGPLLGRVLRALRAV